MDVLDGRPTGLQAEFPIQALRVEGVGLPAALRTWAASPERIKLLVNSFQSPSAGLYVGQGTLKVGATTLPMTLEAENLSLPSGSSAYLTTRTQIKLDNAALTQLAAHIGLRAAPLPSSEFQTTLWFMAHVKEEFSEMALA